MPALADVLGPHAQPDARPDLVARHGRSEKLLAAEIPAQLGDREQRREHHRTDMQHARAMHVVELEALYLRAVRERCVRRREAQRGPHTLHEASLSICRACRAGSGTTPGARHRGRSPAHRE